MDHELIIFRPPIPPSDFQEVESAIREAGVLTCFDQKVDPANAFRFVSEKFRFDTESRVLIDLNVFRDILSLGRRDPGRGFQHGRLAAALVLFFQAAEILVEPCMALHESPTRAEEELELFRQIDNADPNELLEVFRGQREVVSLPPLPSPVSLPVAALSIPLHGTAILEVALLKLATLLRAPMSNIERVEAFLRWSHREFLFVQEPILLALHQLAGNQPKPLLRGVGRAEPRSRLEGVQNALWDCLLIREWSRRIAGQSTANELWLLCSRDQTLSDYARKLVVTGSGVEDLERVVASIVSSAWPPHHAKRITKVYHELIAETDHPARAFNRADHNLNLESLKANLHCELEL